MILHAVNDYYTLLSRNFKVLWADLLGLTLTLFLPPIITALLWIAFTHLCNDTKETDNQVLSAQLIFDTVTICKDEMDETGRISSLEDTILKLRNEKAALQAALEKTGVTPFTAPMSSKNNDSGKLLEEHQELLNKYGTMNDNYRNLQKDHKNLEKQYGSINKQNQELINDYQVLNRKYQELNSKYQELINKKSVVLQTPQPPQQQQTVTVVQPPASLSAARMLQIKTRIAKQLENFDRQVEIDGMGWRNVIIMTMAPTLKNMRDIDERKYAHDLYLSHLQGKPNFSSMYIFSEYCTKLIKE